MVWKQPKISEIKATPEIIELIGKSIYFNREGNLQDSSLQTRMEYGGLLIVIVLGLTGILRILFGITSFTTSLLNITTVFAFLILLGIFGYLFFTWGFRTYKEAWYYFDDSDEIFTVVKLDKKNEWEIFEIPYEDIDEIEWSDGPNGHAVIHAAGFEFNTNKTRDKRTSSVTELWSKLARINTKMRSWPYSLTCAKCKRRFGNHTGTAQCPFDETLLIDLTVKGRIDPKEIHPQDLDRL